MSEKNINIFFFIVLGFLRPLFPLNPSFFFSFSKFTSYFAFTDVCASIIAVFLIIDSGDFGSLYASAVPPAEDITGTFLLNVGSGGRVDILLV